MDLALTFDVEHPDQPSGDPRAVADILTGLGADGIRATFFIQGSWACAYPDLAREIAARGHLVGLHSHLHAPYTYLHDEGLEADLARGLEAVTNITGTNPKPWFRLPYGRGHDDKDILAKLQAMGFESVYWNIDPRDWDHTGTTRAVADAILAGAAEQEGPGVVVCHAWSRRTAEAIPMVLEGAPADARFVTIDQISGDWLADMPARPVWRRNEKGPYVGA